MHMEEGPAVDVVVVQPNVDPYREKFGGVDPLAQLDRMLDLAGTVITPSTRLVVFPETALQENATVDLHNDPPATHGLWENDLEAAQSVKRLRAFQQRHPQAALLSGMSSAYLLQPGEPLRSTARPLGDDHHWYEAYNAAVFIGTRGAAEPYHKSKLVAGVELMPFEEVLGPLSELALDLGGTTGSLGAQAERTVFADPASGLRIAPAICYESVFGEHVAAHVRNGANLIAIMTNDGWWGRSAGYRQHLAFAPLRAIELRRSIARSANTGISCFIDQRGGIHEATEWWVPDARRYRVHLNERITFFAQHGDVLGLAAVWLAVVLIIAMATARWWWRPPPSRG
jgi:apolipoprotein N-acyltransferase